MALLGLAQAEGWLEVSSIGLSISPWVISHKGMFFS